MFKDKLTGKVLKRKITACVDKKEFSIRDYNICTYKNSWLHLDYIIIIFLLIERKRVINSALDVYDRIEEFRKNRDKEFETIEYLYQEFAEKIGDS